MAFHSSLGSDQAKAGSPSFRKSSYSFSPRKTPASYSASATSITSGCGPVISASARLIVDENSRSVNSTLASPWSSWKAIASASSRVLSVFSTAPDIGTPKWHSYIAGVFGSIAATVSPGCTPRRCSALASWRQRR